MDELAKLYNDENLPHWKRKQRIIAIADNIINQILKEDSNLVDAQIIAGIVNIAIEDIVDTGWQISRLSYQPLRKSNARKVINFIKLCLWLTFI